MSEDDPSSRIAELFQGMDRAYCRVAAEVGLSCEGCDGIRCCTVDLRMFTSAEMDYLRAGLDRLEPHVRDAVQDRCRSMVESKLRDPDGEEYRNMVCVLNLDGRCALYDYRPMICRLAGLPHFAVRPDGSLLESGGCERFRVQIENLDPSLRIDRTGFYNSMAALELETVQKTRKRTNPQTISETLHPDNIRSSH